MSSGGVREIEVSAKWDDEAEVWVAHSDHVPGLITEADTMEALLRKLRILIPELLELNTGRALTGDIPVKLSAERTLHYAFDG